MKVLRLRSRSRRERRGVARAAQVLVVVVLGLNSIRCPAVTSGPDFGCSQPQNEEVLGRPFPDLPAGGKVAVFSVEQGPAGLQPRVEAYSDFQPSTVVSNLRTCPLPDGGVILEGSGTPIDLGTVRLAGVGPGCDGGECPQVVTFEFRDGGYVPTVPIDPSWGWGSEVTYTLVSDLRTDEQRDAGIDPIIREYAVGMSFPQRLPAAQVEIPSTVSLDGGVLNLQWPPQKGQYVLVTLRGSVGNRVCRGLDFEGEPCPAGKACLMIPAEVLGTVGTGPVEVEIRWLNASSPSVGDLDQARRDLQLANLVGFGTWSLRFTIEVTP